MLSVKERRGRQSPNLCPLDRRTGFTIVEVLVATGLIGLLVALLLPAIMHSRERARRMECSHRIKQLVLACHSHHEAFGMLPPPHATDATVAYQTFFTRLLPFIGEPELSPALMGETRRIGLFICPSDSIPAAERRPLNFLINSGPDIYYNLNGIVPEFQPESGWSVVSFGSITDGLSSTAAISECVTIRATAFGQTEASPLQCYPWYIPASVVTSTSSLEPYIERCENGPRTLATPASLGVPSADRINDWAVGIGTNGGRYTHAMRPNTPVCGFRSTSTPKPIPAHSAAQSMHWGGVNVGMLDGSVRFVADVVDRKAWRALGTRNGGEQVSGE